MNRGLRQSQPADGRAESTRGFDTQHGDTFALDQQTTAGHLGIMPGAKIMVDAFITGRQPQPSRFAADAQAAGAIEAKHFALVKQKSCVGKHVKYPLPTTRIYADSRPCPNDLFSRFMLVFLT
jgi:hypothetical protein